MVETRVKYDKEKLAGLKKAAEEARSNLKNARPAYQRAAVYLDQWVQKNFRTEGGNVGGWEPFDRGGRWRKGYGLDVSAKLLQDTGALRLSFKPFATKKTAGIGSDLDYSEFHNEGIGVPERRILPKQSEVKGPINDILSQFVNNDLLGPLRGVLE